MVEQESAGSTQRGSKNIVEVIVVARLPHTTNLHEHRQHTSRESERNLVVELAVVGQSALSVVKNKNQGDKEIEDKVSYVFRSWENIQRIDTKGVIGECEVKHQQQCYY